MKKYKRFNKQKCNIKTRKLKKRALFLVGNAKILNIHMKSTLVCK